MWSQDKSATRSALVKKPQVVNRWYFGTQPTTSIPIIPPSSFQPQVKVFTKDQHCEAQA